MNSTCTRLPVGGQAPLLAQVRAAEGLAGDHQVSFGNLLLDLHRGVGERRQEHAVVALEGLGGPTRGGQGTAAWEGMVHELRVKHAVGCRQVVLVLAHLDKATTCLLSSTDMRFLLSPHTARMDAKTSAWMR
jgi:hypothetical protein